MHLDPVERWLWRLTVSLLLLVCIFQVLLQFSETHSWLIRITEWEGRRYP